MHKPAGDLFYLEEWLAEHSDNVVLPVNTPLKGALEGANINFFSLYELKKRSSSVVPIVRTEINGIQRPIIVDGAQGGQYDQKKKIVDHSKCISLESHCLVMM